MNAVITPPRPADAPTRRPLQLPEPVAPAGGIPVDGHAASFSWQGVPGAEGYRVQVAVDAAFEQCYCDAEVGRTTLLTLMDTLPVDGTTCYWRVCAGRDGEADPWSAPAAFRAVGDEEAAAYEAAQAAAQAASARVRTERRPAAGAVSPVPYRTATTSGVQAGIFAVLFILMVLAFLLIGFNFGHVL